MTDWTEYGVQKDREIPSSMRDEILDLLGWVDRGFGADEIADALHTKNGWEQSSVRSLLTKMAHDGVIDRPRRGVYRLRGQS